MEGLGDVQFQDVILDKANGRRVEVNGTVEDVNPFGLTAGSTPADFRFKKLTIPGLEPGDTLSYRVVHRESPLSPGRVFGDFVLPDDLPAGTPLTYELDLPRAAGIRVRLRDGLGADWEELPAPPDRLLRRLAFKADRAGDSGAEPDVMFSSFRSWAEVSSWWWAMSKERLGPDAAVTKEAAALAAGVADARGRLNALLPFLATRIRYVNVSFGLGRMRPRFAAEVLHDRYGDCKDKHALLAALASSLGIDVRPVLLNSERDTLHDDVPGPQQFDHLISVARLGASPAEWLWLDGTNTFALPGYLMPALRDKPALLVEADGTAVMVRTPREPPFVSRWETTFKGAIDAEGVLRGRTTSTLRSDYEASLRALFAELPREQWPGVARGMLADGTRELSVQNVTVSDPLDAAAPFRIEFDLEFKLSATGGERALSVPLPSLDVPQANEAGTGGEPAVTFDVRETVARAEIQLAEGLTASAPLSVSLERPFATFRSVYAIAGRTLTAERTLTLPRSTLAEADRAAYESLRAAVTRDGKQEFMVEGAAAAAADAEDLHREGMGALSKKDYATAIDRLTRAGELDPKLKDVFQDLGRALYALGRDADAVAAFSRQVEVAPFSEGAYAWRAHALKRLGREDEAEKDLLKQIEVAPFQPWSYERMGERRWRQHRLPEAVDFYARAAAIEPKSAERWLDLGEAQETAGRQADARASLERAIAVGPSPWLKLRAAALHDKLDDLARAGQLAEEALPQIRGDLLRFTAADLTENNVYWSGKVIEAWTLVGVAAAGKGDLPRAERYLEAAWTVGLAPAAGAFLASLRMQQRRLVEAFALGSVVAQGALTARGSGERLRELRTVKLTGPAIADLTEEVLLLVGGDGAVQSVSSLSRGDAGALERQLARLEPIRLGWSPPDAEPFKLVRRARLTCSPASGCALTLAPL
jgi:tetratricopeptide (TPR) repeat protein